MKNFYKWICGASAALLLMNGTVQGTERCGTREHHQMLMKANPEYARSFQDNERTIREWIEKHKNMRTSNVVDTIPVVVHVVWKTAVQNISDAQVISQIDVLNEDFARTNADTNKTPAIWKPISGSLPYHFVFARRDPQGNPTTGIVRVQTNTTSFSTDDAVKFNSQGGSDAWDTDLYLNLWACNLVSGLYGYGEFPDNVHTNTYGFVCDYTCFGRVGAVQAPLDLGRTTTHEIGHCFDLSHIWGDESACAGSDNISDTPNQAGPTNFTCYAFPHTDACSPNSPGVMFMNYMDYSVDSCLNMFTQGQVTRMISALNSFYPTLINSSGIQPVILQATDAGIPSILSPGAVLCDGNFTPVVRIKNWGTTNLTSATIYYRTDANSWQSYSWNGNLVSLDTQSVSLPAALLSAGNHTFDSYSALPNGLADQNNANDSTSTSFSIVLNGVPTPISESFSAGGFPPVGWTVDNPDGSITWQRVNTSHAGGTGSMRIDNYNYSAVGAIDEINLPVMDLTSVSAPELTFYLAHRLYSDPAGANPRSDTLEVLISLDCGNTFTSLYKKAGIPLSTTNPVWQQGQFTPTSSQWRMESISLSAYATSTNALVVFRNITDYQNFLYVDDINITTATGMKEVDLKQNFVVYPNPSNGNVTISNNNPELRNLDLVLYDFLGKKVYEKRFSRDGVSIESFDLSGISSGVYLLQILTDKGIVSEKLILEK